MRAAHVDDWKSGIGLPDLRRDFPAAQPALQDDVGDERPVVFEPAPEQGKGLFARRKNVGRKAALDQDIFNDALDRVLVLDDEDHR